MKALILLGCVTLSCSTDWSLARHSTPPDAAGGSGGAAAAQSVAVRCDELEALASAPVIDGKLEPNLTLLRWLDQTDPELPAGMQVAVALAYRPNGVYFYFDVVDPTLDPAPRDALTYCGDGVELYVDDDGKIQAPPAYDSPGTMQFIVAGPSEVGTPAHRGQRFTFPNEPSGDSTDLGEWRSQNFVAVGTTRGYTVEAFVVASDLGLDAWALAPGAKIGWNMSFNIGGPQPPGIDACTTRNQQFHFRLASSGACTPPYCNASALCTPTLVAQ